MDRIAKLIPNRPGKSISLREAVDSEPRLQQIAEAEPIAQRLFAITEAGKLEMMPEEVDLHELIDECIESSMPLARGKQMKVEKNVPLELPPSTFATSCCFVGRDLVVTTGNHTEHAELGGCVLRTRVDVGGAAIAAARV